jgi:hypothetical protein
MTNIPRDTLADARQIRKAARSLRRKNIIDSLIRRGIAPDRIEQTIKNAELAAEKIATKARSRIAHQKRAKLRIVKSSFWAIGIRQQATVGTPKRQFKVQCSKLNVGVGVASLPLTFHLTPGCFCSSRGSFAPSSAAPSRCYAGCRSFAYPVGRPPVSI